MSPSKSPLPGDGIYRTILLVMVLSVVAGAIVTFVGAYALRDDAISRAGTWLALISAGIYVFFRLLGRREMRRRDGEKRDGDRSGDRDPDDP